MFYSLISRVLAACCDPNTQTCLPGADLCPSSGQFPSSGLIPGSGIENPLNFDTLTDLLIAVSKWLFKIAIPIVTIMILYGAFQMLTAAGNPEQFSKGKRTILYAIIGLVVVLIASGIPDLIKQLT